MSDEVSFDTKGIEKMIKALNKIGVSPQKAVNKAASKAITPVKRAIKSGDVPVGPSGNLKRAIVRKGEKSRYRGKKVYEVTFDRKMNDLLQKPIKNPGIYGGKSPKAYYPASQEYGFLVRAPGEGYLYKQGIKGSNQFRKKWKWAYRMPSRKIEGKYFMKKGAASAEPEAKKIMVNTLEKELDKLWQEAKHN